MAKLDNLSNILTEIKDRRSTLISSIKLQLRVDMSEVLAEQSETIVETEALPKLPECPSQPKEGRYKYLHLLYWIVAAMLIWKVVELSQQQSEMLQSLREDKAREEQMQAKLGSLDNQKELLKRNEEQLSVQIRESSLKANNMLEHAMEKHYIAKVEYMRQLAKTQNFLKENEKARTAYLLGLNNFKLVHSNIHIKREIDDLLKSQYERLSKEHDFTLPEKPFCIVVPTINNAMDFRYYYNIRSILNQNYTNFKVVIVDDASTDDNYQLIQQYLKENPVEQQVFVLKNQKHMGTVHNIYKAVHEYCNPQDIVVLVDGDDELLGVNILKVYNSVYLLKGLGVLYSSMVVSDSRAKILKKGWSSGYSDIEKKQNRYRPGSTRMFPLRSFRASVFLMLKASDLQEKDGTFFLSASDQAICPQVLEYSCGKNEHIDEFFYLYNFGLGSNDIEIDFSFNIRIMDEVHRRKRHECPS